MSKANVNGISIEYDTFGEESSRPLLLIMGLGQQMISWDEDFCRTLAGKGYYVIRFDNRDVGLSTHFHDAGMPDVMKAMAASMQGQKFDALYTLDDMADDSVALLDALSIDKAHICGVSMGGMIAQTIAIRHPERVLSLISIMSKTGDPAEPQGKPEVMSILFTRPPKEREANIDYGLKVWRTLGGPGFPFDEERSRKKVTLAFDRSYDPEGIGRQIVAVMAHGNRTPLLKKVSVPALVIHGSADPLIPVACGEATARAIPGAELLIIEGMGHDLPVGAWPKIIDAIVEHTKKAQD